MSIELTNLIVAVRRDKRSEQPAGWREAVEHLEGVQVVASRNDTVQIRATRRGLEALSDKFGWFLHIEPLIPHERAAVESEPTSA